ncbi:MAG: hypothetical protein NZM02_00050 [Patescibacteria group bacterium]|nr:hypothetical protein [Patescibacteria group bacterium]
MKKTFTLIETIIVIGVLGLFIPTIFIIIFTLSREQLKINRLSLIKREGDYLINNLSLLIKNNAYSIHSSDPPDDLNIVCNKEEVFSSLEKLIFKDKDNNWFKISLNNDKISSYSSINNQSLFLNSNKIKIYNFSISCQNSSFYSSPIINLNFDICYKGSKNNCISTQEEIANLHYQTKIKLRNY